ncbi:ABC transporter permease [Roseivirga sp. E12]|uniref:ABC transporter permease n=1 Tax=Roseivirga sp. E12 TaxID=2819237 RepID=UPI001ABCEF1B|nr:ABC transporter permease [Roseivirga sp. E12]MBO3699271.1 ABC transporter permease [Roseivirga sp. E12]
MKRIKHKPPQLALRFFRWYCRPDRLEELEGDIEEFFYLRLENGEPLWKANLFFYWNVLLCFKSYSKSKNTKTTLMTSLFKSYFKIALRHSWKNKGSVAINIIGLGLALSMCVFVFMIHAYNLEFDSFYKNTDDLYRIHAITEQSGEERRNEFSPVALDYQLRNQVSDITQVSSYYVDNGQVKKDTEFFSETVAIVSTDFPDMFELPLWYGSFSEFGNLPLVFLTKPVAQKYFGNRSALGEKFTLLLSKDKRLEVTVGGVLEKLPLNSSFRFGIMINQLDYMRSMDINPNDWSNGFFPGQYVKLPSSQKPSVLANINKSIPLQNDGNKLTKVKRFELIPFSTAKPSDLTENVSYVNSRIRPEGLIIFSVLALMVFLIACFNFANTSIALISRRLKEIGVRKTLGSGSRQILVQFLLEMGITNSLAFIVAISTANLTSKAIMGPFGASFLLEDINLTSVILFVSGFLLFTTLVAGLLPALYAWKFQPVAIMRRTAKLKGVGSINKVLTVSQYSFSIILLVTGITFWQNSDFLNKLDLGYRTEGIIDLPIDSEYFEELRQEIDQIPGVVTAGATNHIGDFGRYSKKVQFQLPEDTSSATVRFHNVGNRYLEVMEIEINSGRGFIEESKSDQDKILVSQSLVEEFFDGQDAINQVVKINGERKTIIGVTIDIIDDVVKAAELLPTVIALYEKSEYEHLVVKVSSRDLSKVESSLKSIWSKYIDEPYAGVRQKDFALGTSGEDSKVLQKIFLSMAILSGFLSIAGIFSLAQLNVSKRIKEISIRKVLGASFKELLLTINKSFAITLSIALLLGSTLGYVISDQVLNAMYKYHVESSISISLLCGIAVIMVSIFTISSVVRTPIRSSLVHGLRDE